MELDSRNPDQILEQMQAKEAENTKGKLKIFFGYAAGVGKTFSMLEAAQEARKSGVDVVAGYIEPHTRPDTLSLLEGLECLPTKTVRHGGIELKEFHIDLALKRKPELILVDEFAHTNVPGSRHEKRYQDIEELLKAGIDVYTTVNVQHIESLNDIVSAITGITVREKIPDSAFDMADQIEIIDIEPQELIERLKSGKVYKRPQAERAVHHFFTMENLTALREIALRRCADHVNTVSVKSKIKKHDDYFTNEHILVGLSSSPTNAKIIRTAARMAGAFKADFTAVFVETPEFSLMNKENRERLQNNIHLAEQLGATIETIYGDNIPYQLAEFAKSSGTSKIVIGRSAAISGKVFHKQTLVEKLISYAPALDIYVIPDSMNNKPYHAKQVKRKPKKLLYDFIVSFLIMVLSSVLGLVFRHYGFEEANIIMVYVLAVLITSVVTYNRIFSMISSVVSVLVFNFLFTEPFYSLKAYDPGYPFTFFIMFMTAFLTSSLAVKLKDHAKKSTSVALRTKVLLETSQALQHVKSKEEIMRVTAKQLMQLTNQDVVTYCADGNSLEDPVIYYADDENKSDEYLSAKEKTVALWVLKNNKHAGATTQTLSGAKCLYLAVRTGQTVFGVIGIAIGTEAPDAFQKSILLSILGECALAMQNEKNAREKEAAAVLAKNEQLRANLLRAISHDLRTPLTSISGNASNFLTNGDSLDEETKKQLFTDIYDDSMWLINLVENLLSVTRLEENRLNLHLSTELVADVVEEALRHISRKKDEHHILVSYEDEFLLARMDAKLIVQVIINMVDNAIKYTQKGSTIQISTKKENGMAVISVSDNGSGIADDMKPKIFDMFYCGSNNKVADSHRSLGLGLSLCKSIVTAHGGEISVSDNTPCGTVFTFTLPVGGDIVHE